MRRRSYTLIEQGVYVCIAHGVLLSMTGIDMLTNQKAGHAYGCVCGWRMCKRRQLGVLLLHKAFRTLLIHTPQELFPDNL